jgi:SAM-dependent methyltransferase
LSTLHCPLDAYESLAAEYYNGRLHPTCANFREGSKAVLNWWLAHLAPAELVFCEVGAGKSLLAELLSPRLKRLDNVFLLDRSPSMLEYSRRWAELGAHLLVADALHIPLASDSVDVIVASLGDPYNLGDFWVEARRLLKPGGMVFFTTPSYDWARAFRDQPSAGANVAEFEVSGTRRVLVESYILPINDQATLLRRSLLAIEETVQVPMSALKETPLSLKLLPHRGPGASVVTGYALRPVV